jgi:F-box-like
VQKEADEELKEFDENIEYRRDSDSEEDDEKTLEKSEFDSLHASDALSADKESNKNKEKEMELEFAAWQNQVGMDASTIESSLLPVERYGLRYREDIDPFYSIYAVMEHQRQLDAEADKENEIDIDELELRLEADELKAIEDGDLLATNTSPGDLLRQRELYRRHKSRIRGNKKRRKLTGENWECRIDGRTQFLFWHNMDTGESTWDKPDVLVEMEAYKIAREKKWSSLPSRPLVHIMKFLMPFPYRQTCSLVCKQWRKAVNDPSFILHICPVERGASWHDQTIKKNNDFRTLADAVEVSLPGDTLGKSFILLKLLCTMISTILMMNAKALGDGHHWQNSDLVVDKPLRFVGDENNPSNVVVEMGGSLIWHASGGFIEGITFRRPKLATCETPTCAMLEVSNKGKVDIIQTVFDNEGSVGNVSNVFGSGSKGQWCRSVFQCGSIGVNLVSRAHVILSEVRYQ